LKEKSARIEKQKNAVAEYQNFLTKVLEKNTDEYSEI